tara:strand:- start:54 stop:272 length:219 start_codon:yes stop_codon:yes gene_type:complete
MFEDDPRADKYDSYGRYYPRLHSETMLFQVNALDRIIDYYKMQDGHRRQPPKRVSDSERKNRRSFNYVSNHR